MTSTQYLSTKWNIRRSLRQRLNLNFLLGSISLCLLALIWEFARPMKIPYLGELPPISEVVYSARDLITSDQYFQAWVLSLQRIGIGFVAAQIVGIPLGLAMAMSRSTYSALFPVMEMLRPIPPVAWIPMAVIFFPSRELSVVSIVFLGAFWIVLINTIGGASTVDVVYKRAALSLGSKPRDLFWRIILPASMPSIVTGMAVGMGVSWEMVVASEMIAGNTGLGYLLWQSFEINAFAQVIVCVISIGVAGYLSSALIRLCARFVTPWRKAL